MTIKTSKGQTYQVEWIDGPTITTGGVVLSLIEDNRRLPDIAADFDGLTEIQRYSETQGDKTFTGFTRLWSITLHQDGAVMIELRKE